MHHQILAHITRLRLIGSIHIRKNIDNNIATNDKYI